MYCFKTDYKFNGCNNKGCDKTSSKEKTSVVLLKRRMPKEKMATPTVVAYSSFAFIKIDNSYSYNGNAMTCDFLVYFD